jgi:pyruvate kinase
MAAGLRQTKIVATVGPASSDLTSIEALIGAGVDVFRLNFSHGTHDSHAQVVSRTRDAATPGVTSVFSRTSAVPRFARALRATVR